MSAGRDALPTQPLSASWRDWVASAGWAGRQWTGAPFDAIVVGSGYGGSVAALRLAEKGYRVLLLERGSEYLPGEFPNDFSLVPKFFRVNIPTQPVPSGRASGLIELHLGQGMVAVTGNGLGGTSLINAGVVIQPDADVFAQPHWPAALRHGERGGLGPWYDKAHANLGVSRWDSALPGQGRLHKTSALERLADQLEGKPIGLDLTIDPEQCLRCGDCAAGCNVAGAKRSLTTSYLREALLTGQVQIVSQAEVYRFERDTDAGGAHRGWKVHAFATDAQQEFQATRELFTDPRPSATWRELRAPLLFICAGTFGSTQLLQRSQSLSGGSLAFSPALGTRVSGNGDSISCVVNEPQPAGAVGRGQEGVRQWQQALAGQAYRATDIVGPTITAAIDLRGPDAAGKPRPLDQRLLVQDGAIPRTIAQLYRELLATAGTLKALDGWWFPRPLHPGARGEDPLAASDLQARHSQVLLTMGHDGSPARLVWLEGQDRSAPYLPEPEKLDTYVAQQELFGRLGTRHVHNPLWQAMPADAAKLMSGPKPGATVSTVHPLGGCVMGDDPASGVVNDLGEVWIHDPGRGFVGADGMASIRAASGRGVTPNAPRRYVGLHVLDGSIVPTSLGCNPLWTITALAERALDAIPRKAASPVAEPSAHEPGPLRGGLRVPVAFPSEDVPIEARLNEVLLAHDLPVAPALARHLGMAVASARLDATFFSDDLLGDMRTADHKLRTEAALVIGTADEHARVALRYVADHGDFSPLPANAGSVGPGLFLRSMAELALLVVAVLASAFAWIWSARLEVVALLVQLVVLPLPFPRTLLTWYILRGKRDIAERDKTSASLVAQAGSLLERAVALVKQLVHASEKRVMRYEVPMTLTLPAEPPPGVPPTVTLYATKTVMYRASLAEFARWIRRRGRGEPLRPTVWEQVMNAQVKLVAGRKPFAARALLRGTMRMGFENLTSSGLSSARRDVKPAMELGLRGDTTTGALALASYPLLFLRYAFKTRLLDFRLPNYSRLPVPDCAPDAETELRVPGGASVPAEVHWLAVQRGRSSNDGGDESMAPLRLPLRRYRQRDVHGQLRPPTLREGEWMGQPVTRAKSVLLLHAFGQSGLTYTLKTVDENLAERFYRDGYEVWILEMRMSTRSGYAAQPGSVDQIALHDVPAAVHHIRETLEHECGGARPLQVAAFAQCIGSASLWMALLSGKLRHPGGQPSADGRAALSMLSHAMFSQVHPWIVGARTTQSKTWVPALLQALWRRGAIPFAVRGPQDGVFLPMLDRIFASLPAPAREGRSFGGHDDAAATCRRIRFIEAPLFRHENLNDATFGAMNLLFGDANLRLFAQARRFVDRERLVNEDGADCYVTDENLARHLAFPVQLLHGGANELFDVQSVHTSFDGLGNFHRSLQDDFCREGNDAPAPLVIPGYGHLDVLIGQAAAADVYPRVLGFFERCWQARAHGRRAQPLAGWAARAPRLGPFVGWTRMQDSAVAVRVSFVIDDRGSLREEGAAVPIRLRYRLPGQPHFVTWSGQAWRTLGDRRPGHAKGAAADPLAHRFAWADIVPEGDAADAEDWQVLSLHPAWTTAGGMPLLPSPDVTDAELDAVLEAAPAVPPDATVVPPLSLGGDTFDAEAARFRIPPASVASARQAGPVSFAVASCRHPGFGIDQSRVNDALHRYLHSPQAATAAFAMLLGDQIYADATAGLVDPNSPLERYQERHETAFGRVGMGALLAHLPVYMTPDDHEWGDAWPVGGPLAREHWPDWTPGSGYLRRQQGAQRIADRAITAFQRLQSPQGERPLPRYHFTQGCTRVFVIDSRSGRDRESPRIVRASVLRSLESWLARPEAAQALNIVACGSVMLPGLRGNADPANPGTTDNWQYAPEQRRQLLEMLVRLAPRRFLLLSGDYHLSGAALIEQDGAVVGAAVLAPALYAPMPYANATPDAVFVDEEVDLGGGRAPLRMRVPPQGEIARGTGLATLEVAPTGSGWTIGYRRELWTWEAGQASKFEATLAL
jgi:choline dehydrogenase-like flavoprotein